MKKLFYLIFTMLFLSCSQSAEQERTLYDFGTIDYEEPFRGILKKQPSILKKSLTIPPYKWLAPDTLSLQKTFIIDFNEDAVRSGATATLFFADSLYSRIKGVDFYISEGQRNNNTLTVVADSLTKVVTVVCRIDPQIGEKEITGNLFLSCHEIDQINSVPIQQETVNLAEWKVKQNISIPWLLWLLWLLTAVIMISCIIFITYNLFKFIFFVAKPIANINLSFARNPQEISIKNSTQFNKRNNIKKKNDDSNRYNEDQYSNLKRLCNLYRISQTIPQGALLLRQIESELINLYTIDTNIINTFKNIDPDVYHDICALRGTELEKYGGIYDLPSNNGIWTGEKGDSMWIPSDDYHPKNRSYSNVQEKSWKMIKEQYDIEGIIYKNGIPDFSPIVYDSVSFDWHESLGEYKFKKLLGTKKERKDLHEEAFKLLSEKLKCSVAEIKAIKEKKGFNLAWHEDIDCKTLYLVYQEVHGNLSHVGGISLTRIVACSHARIHRINL